MVKLNYSLILILIGCSTHLGMRNPSDTLRESTIASARSPATDKDLVELGELLPPSKNPSEVSEFVKMDAFSVAVIRNFDSTSASQRHYDHIAPLDGVTLGFGHWPQSEMGRLFRNLNQNPTAYANFLARSEQLLSTLSSSEKDSLKLSDSSFTQTLEKTLFSANFMKSYAVNCHRDSSEECDSGPNLYRDLPWLKKLIPFAFRDSTVVQWQVNYFKKGIVDPAISDALSVGFQVPASEAAIVGLASIRSSAPAWISPLQKATETGTLSLGNFSWSWNKHPTLTVFTPAQLDRWREVILFQYYCQKKGYFRNRTQKYFTDYLAKDWEIPSPGKNDISNCDPKNIKMK